VVSIGGEMALEFPFVFETFVAFHVRTLHQTYVVLGLHVFDNVRLEFGCVRIEATIFAFVIEAVYSKFQVA